MRGILSCFALLFVVVACAPAPNSLEQQIMDLEGENADLSQSVTELESTVLALKQDITETSDNKGEKEDEVRRLTLENARLVAERTAIEECLLNQVNLFENQEPVYAEGQIIVGFEYKIPPETARSMIASLGLTVDAFGQLWTDNPWAVVLVPAGEEVKWSCRLPLEEGIRHAGLNYVMHAS